MRIFRSPVFLMCCCALSLCLSSGRAAAANAELVQIVSGLYSNFSDDAAMAPSDLDLIYSFADARLKKLIDKEIACQKAAEGICNYEASVIVNGQDYEIKDLKVAETSSTPDKCQVSASFRNFGQATKVVYLFEKSQGKWLLADIQPQGEASGSLVKILSE